jgi:uncharacterized protein YdhG (YjbR/CyaY superfamily)
MIKKTTKNAKAASGAPAELAAVEAYLAKVAEPARSTLESVRRAIRSAAPAEAVECISYGMPAFRYKGALVGYAAFKDHCSFFPMSAVLLDEFEEDVKGYRTAKGTLQFPHDKPLPAKLVKQIVKVRVLQNEEKAAAKSKSKKSLLF